MASDEYSSNDPSFQVEEEDDGGMDEYQQQQQHEQYDDEQPYADEQQHGSDPHQSEFADDPSQSAAAMMQLHLGGSSQRGDGGDLSAGDASAGSYPLFKVGEAVARSRGVMPCVKCDRTTGRVFIGTYAGELICFDFAHHRELWRRRIDASDERPLQMTCLDVRGNQVAIGSAHGETVVYDTDSFTVTQRWHDHTQRVSGIAWVGENQHVYTTSHDGYFLVRDAERDGKILHSFITCTCPLSAMQVESPNVVYLGSWDGQIKRLDLEKKQVTLVIKVNAMKESPIRCFALAPAPVVKKRGAKKSASGGGDEAPPAYILVIAHGIGEIRSYDLRTGKVHVEAYQGCHDVVNSMVAWNGKLYAAGDDKCVRLFDVHTGVCLESLSGHESGIGAIDVAGITPIVTPEMLEAQQAAAAAASHRSSSRKGGRGGSAAPTKGGQDAMQQGVGNEILLTAGLDGQTRAYRIAAIEAAVQLKMRAVEEQTAAAFEQFVAGKSKSKKGATGKSASRKGSAKKKSSSSGASSKKTSAKSSAAPSKANTARSTAGDAAKPKGSAKKKKTTTKKT